jgi:shikimate kinase
MPFEKPTFYYKNTPFQCVTFIGMSGVGKSTLGKGLARELGYQFLDTDHVLQDYLGGGLQHYIETRGDDAFIEAESRVILSLSDVPFRVIATGGSVIYSEEAMTHLRTFSLVVFLEDSLSHIRSRVTDVDHRGIVGLGNRSFDVLFNERQPLYRRYAHVTVPVLFPFKKYAMIQRILAYLKEIHPA